jgi:hypothetical protein
MSRFTSNTHLQRYLQRTLGVWLRVWLGWEYTLFLSMKPRPYKRKWHYKLFETQDKKILTVKAKNSVINFKYSWPTYRDLNMTLCVWLWIFEMCLIDWVGYWQWWLLIGWLFSSWLLFVLVGGARLFSLENARAIAVNKSPEQRA